MKSLGSLGLRAYRVRGLGVWSLGLGRIELRVQGFGVLGLGVY